MSVEVRRHEQLIELFFLTFHGLFLGSNIVECDKISGSVDNNRLTGRGVQVIE